MNNQPCADRRRLLFGLAAPMALGLSALPLRSAEAASRERSLTMHHLHTGETLNAAYYADGRYQAENVRAFSWLLRDWRESRAKPVDPELLDLVWALRRRLDSTAPVQIVCGYRTPRTNAFLRRRSEGVAKNSLHLRAMAVDLKFPDRPLRTVRDAALSLRRGGVGYYPGSDFVHVDTGDIRTW